MPNIVKFCLSLGLLSTIVHALLSASLKTKLNKIATSKTLIAGRFSPYKNEFIDVGADDLICSGERYSDKKNVTLKFIKNKKAAEREYEMYSYLKAMEKPESLEKFGFANVYFYAEWEEHYLLVLSKFVDGYLEAKQQFLRADVGHDTINGLLLFRNFVRQTKYMHSCGIRHDNINPQNIMLQKNQTFLINFESGSKMLEDNLFGTPKYAARAYHKKQNRTASCDWESFLYSMCDLYGIDLYWFSHNISNDDSYFDYKNMENTMLTEIRKSIKAIHLQTVFVEFIYEIFKKSPEDPYPDYERFEDLISKQIKKLTKPTKPYEIFSWENHKHRFLEFEKKQSEPNFDIKVIPDPKLIDFKAYKYPVVNYKHFTQARLDRSVSDLFSAWISA